MKPTRALSATAERLLASRVEQGLPRDLDDATAAEIAKILRRTDPDGTIPGIADHVDAFDAFVVTAEADGTPS